MAQQGALSDHLSESPLHPRDFLMLLVSLKGSPILDCPSDLDSEMFFLKPFSAPPKLSQGPQVLLWVALRTAVGKHS